MCGRSRNPFAQLVRARIRVGSGPVDQPAGLAGAVRVQVVGAFGSQELFVPCDPVVNVGLVVDVGRRGVLESADLLVPRGDRVRVVFVRLAATWY